MFTDKLYGLLSPKIAIDLGTVNTLIAMHTRGIVLKEPTAVAVTNDERRQLVAVGREALMMLGRTPGGINVVYPMRDGVVADFELTEAMLTHYMRKALGHKVGPLGVKLVLCLPMCVTDVERRALCEAAKAAGARSVVLMDEPMAAALGAGIGVDEPRGSMIVDIGGGTTDTAVIAFGGIASYKSVRCGGTHMDAAIIAYVQREYGVMIGARTAEDLKLTLGNAMLGTEERMQIRGRKQDTGMPVSLVLGSGEISRAMMPQIRAIVDAVTDTLAQTPPELSGDVLETGIVLTGGGARIRGIARLVSRETGMRVRVDDSPMECVVSGALLALDCDGDYASSLNSSGEQMPV